MSDQPRLSAAPSGHDAEAGAAAGRRAQLAAERAAQLQDRRQRLHDGEPVTDDDVEAAERAALTEHDRNEEAHQRAAAAHGRAAHSHLAPAEALETAGHHDRAEMHRRAAAAEFADDEAELRKAAEHHRDHPQGGGRQG